MMNVKPGDRYNTEYGWVDVKSVGEDGSVMGRIAVPSVFHDSHHPRGTVVVLRPEDLGERVPKDT